MVVSIEVLANVGGWIGVFYTMAAEPDDYPNIGCRAPDRNDKDGGGDHRRCTAKKGSGRRKKRLSYCDRQGARNPEPTMK
jgi:hypothetical protein